MDKTIGKLAKLTILFFALLNSSALAAKSSFLSNQGVTLAWYPNTDPNTAGYKVYYGTASQQYTHVVTLGDNSVVEITNLVAGTTYYFVVTAYTSFGFESQPSGEISYNVPLPPSGTYNGLFYANAGAQLESAGGFTMQVTAQGGYSGKLQLKGKSCSFSGQLNAQLQVTNRILRAGDSTLTLTMDVQSEQISGQLTDGTWVANLEANRAVYNLRTNPAPFAGTYTLVVPGQSGNSTMPMGSGYGTVKVDGNGLARFTGVLADGTKISQSTTLSSAGQWPLYASLYSGKGLVAGWVTFANQTTNDLSGALSWLKSSGVAGPYYSSGFTDQCVATGSAYTTPRAPQEILNMTHGHLICSGGNLPAEFSNMMMMATSKANGPSA